MYPAPVTGVAGVLAAYAGALAANPCVADRVAGAGPGHADHLPGRPWRLIDEAGDVAVGWAHATLVAARRRRRGPSRPRRSTDPAACDRLAGYHDGEVLTP